jgi:glycine oxidase
VSRVSVDVAVVGAGIVGCSTAWECLLRGASVAVIDAGPPGGQASGAAAGMLAPASEAHEPGAFLDLGLRSLELWPAFAAGVEAASGGDCGLGLDGLLRIAASADDAAAIRSRLEWQRVAGVDVEWLDGPAAAAAEPACGPVADGAALYPGEGHVDSPRTVEALVDALRLGRARLTWGARVEGLAPGGALALEDGTSVDAETVVIAAGAWSGEIAALLGARPLPVRPVRGQLLALSGGAPAPALVLFGGLLGYAVTKADRTVLVGATEEDAGFDAATTPEATEHLLGVAGRLLRGAASATVAGAWAGLRPRTPDALPVLGEVDCGGVVSPCVLIASGHHRNGVLLAPATATGMAQLALERSAPPGWDAFAPTRFG